MPRLRIVRVNVAQKLSGGRSLEGQQCDGEVAGLFLPAAAVEARWLRPTLRSPPHFPAPDASLAASAPLMMWSSSDNHITHVSI